MTYDFNYQQTRILKEEVTILPGDTLITECNYDSTRRKQTTFGGIGTEEEMCLAFMTYYPRVNLSVCTSTPPMETIFETLGIQDIYNKEKIGRILQGRLEVNEEDETELASALRNGSASSEVTEVLLSHMLRAVVVKAPEKFLNTSLYKILLKKTTWEESQAAELLQEKVVFGRHSTSCRTREDARVLEQPQAVSYPRFSALKSPVEQCGARKQVQDQQVNDNNRLPLVKFLHRVVMEEADKYVMLWTPRKDDIIIEVQVVTTGYVGLGFSPIGTMKGSDIMLGWVDDDGKVYLEDRYASGYSVPMIDNSQDVELLGGYQNDTHTVLRFSRPWVTCEPKTDMQLSNNTIRMIWSYDKEDPTDVTSPRYHDQRGTVSLRLKAPPLMQPLTDDVKMWDVISPNVNLPDNVTTLYWCQLHKIPLLLRKTHVIGFVPLIKEKNLEYIRHMLLYECHLSDSDRHYDKWLNLQGSQCYGANMPVSWKYCTSPIVAWVVGGEGEMFPDHVGFPLGEEHGGATYFLMETRYNNPNLKRGIVDASGIRIFYTERLRKFDAGVMTVGHDVAPLHIIPPNQKWLSVGLCHGSCTQKELPAEGVKVFQGLLQAHQLARSISVRHLRHGEERRVLAKDMTYDSSNQQPRIVMEEVTILPMDSLITECTYDSTRRHRATFGGFGAEDEMCLAYLSYYPRVNLSLCTSTPPLETISEALGIQNTYDKGKMGKILHGRAELDEEAERELLDAVQSNVSPEDTTIQVSQMFHTLVVKTPEKYVNMSLHDILHDDVTWQDSRVVAALQEKVVFGRYATKCRQQSARVFSEDEIVPFPDFRARKSRSQQCDINQQGLLTIESLAANPDSSSAQSPSKETTSSNSSVSSSESADSSSTVSSSESADSSNTESSESSDSSNKSTESSSENSSSSDSELPTQTRFINTKSPSKNPDSTNTVSSTATTIQAKPLPCPSFIPFCTKRRMPFLTKSRNHLGVRPYFF
ncbi:MOXD1 homolog 1-like isoform X2 [Cherax quadricarinatus]